jgi:probable rRNA maturation factor
MEPTQVAREGGRSATMIQIDPDLSALSSPSSVKTKSTAASSTTKTRVPSARTLARFLEEAQKAVRLKGEVSVLLTTDRAIRRLNRDFRGKDKATDVLSFPAEAGFVDELIAGDLAISVPTAGKQAATQGHALLVEIKVLLLHGLLHLAGYDHETDAGEMARREQKLRARLGLPLGLIERANQSAVPAKKKAPGLTPVSSKAVNVRAKARTLRTSKPVARKAAKSAAKPAAKKAARMAKKTISAKKAGSQR